MPCIKPALERVPPNQTSWVGASIHASRLCLECCPWRPRPRHPDLLSCLTLVAACEQAHRWEADPAGVCVCGLEPADSVTVCDVWWGSRVRELERCGTRARLGAIESGVRIVDGLWLGLGLGLGHGLGNGWVAHAREVVV